MEGGVIHCASEFSNTCFETFLDDSDVSSLSKGTYGVVLLLTIRHTRNSPYVDIERKPVKTLIVKIGLVAENTNAVHAHRNPVAVTSLKEFKEECKAQEKVFRESLRAYDSALCPGIVHSEVVSWAELKRFYPKLATKMKSEDDPVRFSIIGMETFPNVRALHSSRPTPRMLAICFHLLVRLGAIGYAHGDPSLSNIIVDSDTHRPYLIDFGHPVKLAAKDKRFLQTQLNRITDLPRVMGILLQGFPKEYPELTNWDWVKHTTVAPETPKASELARLVDDGWQR